MERGQSERDRNDIERVGGLGAAPAKRHDHVPKQTLVEKQAAASQMAAYEAEIYGHGGGGGGGGGAVERISVHVNPLGGARPAAGKEDWTPAGPIPGVTNGPPSCARAAKPLKLHITLPRPLCRYTLVHLTQ